MIRKFILLFSLSCILALKAQTEYVEINNPVYSFLERMESQFLISDYDEFEIPKTRRQIAGYLKDIEPVKDNLNLPDQQQYEDLIIEFDLEVSDTTLNSISVFDKEFDLLSDKSKYLYFNSGTSGSIFISLLGEAEMLGSYQSKDSVFTSAYLFQIGGQIRGTLLDKFGYSIKGTNGKGFGDIETAYLKQELQYNLKFNENDENFYDQTEGYFTADFDLVRFKIGRDRMNIGSGVMKPVLNSYSPQFDYISLYMHYDIVTFSYFHGKLLGNITNVSDSITGGSAIVSDKYMGYHRIGFNFSRHLTFGFGEMIIYGDRPMDLSYLNPFNFYKTIEHANRDRDNSLLFMELTNNSFKHLKIYTTLLIDDISFGKINTGWWGNQIMLNAGAAVYNINSLPLDIRLEYQRIEPYTFTHRLSRNSYTNQNFPLGSFAEPNSEVCFAGINYRFSGRINTGYEFYYYVHGANPINDDGSVENVGGDLLLGHRAFDDDDAEFLAGNMEFVRSSSLFLTFEPYNQFILGLRISYISESLQNKSSQEKLQSFINLSIRI